MILLMTQLMPEQIIEFKCYKCGQSLRRNIQTLASKSRLVKVLFFDKDSAIEALKRNASNPDFPMKMGFNHFLFALHITCFRMPGFSHISRRFSAISGTHRAQTIDLAIWGLSLISIHKKSEARRSKGSEVTAISAADNFRL